MNTSSQTTTLVGVRARGTEHGGRKFGGIYYPACHKNGRFVPARWEGNFIINSPDYQDANGQPVKGRRDTVRIVAWNSKNSPAGKGIADTLAKCISVGKEMDFINVELQSFLKTVRADGAPVLNKKGEPVQTVATSFVVRSYRNFRFGNDSKQTIQNETGAYDGKASFYGRPKGWNDVDSVKWYEELTARMSCTYQPNAESYGYARCILPEGAQLGDPNMQVPQTGQTPTQAQANLPDMSAGQAVPNTAGL